MKQVIQIGAGNIGRGFMGAILEQAGWHVTFADVSKAIISEINEKKCYTVHVQDVESAEITVRNIDGVLSGSDEFLEKAAYCDLITTAVGPRVLPVIAVSIAEGLRRRMAAGNGACMNVICCENGLRTTTRLKNEVVKHLNTEELAFVEAHVGFADCAVDRICPKPNFVSPLDAAVESYYEWDVERAAWKGELPEVAGMTFVDDLMAYLERKLFTLNSGHAICAYLGHLKGYRTIRESIADPVIGETVYRAIYESGEGLIRAFSFDAAAHHAYIDRIFRRYQNPFLEDEVIRVGREPIRKLDPADRLVKPMRTAVSYGLPVDHLVVGTAAALRFDCVEDVQSVELQKLIRSEGVSRAIETYTGIKRNEVLFDRVLDAYLALGLAER